MPCTVCSHDQIKDIDRALLSGATLTSLSQLYGLSKSALQRHKTHLQAKMRQAKERLRESLDLGLFLKLSIYLELSLHNARTASTEGNLRASNQAIRECTRIVAMMTKMDLPLDQGLVHYLMFSPQWVSEDGLLPGAFQALAEARQAMSLDLQAPCPEPEPFPPALEANDTEVHQTRSDPSVALEPETENQPLETQNSELGTLLQRWEKSGKLPGKISPTTHINDQYQSHSQVEKTTGKCPAAGRESEAPPDALTANGNQPLTTQDSELGTQPPELETFFHILGEKLKKSGRVIWPRLPLKKSTPDGGKTITAPTSPVPHIPEPVPAAVASGGR